MIVLDTNRPVRRETEFETSADGAAPTGFVRRGEHRVGDPIERVILIAGDGGTALYVKQDVVPGVANLTSKQPKRIDPRTVKVRRKEEARIAAAEIGPVALTFDTEHPVRRLPAIADLATNRATGGVMTAFRRSQARCWIDKIPALGGGAAAAVDADVEPGPVVDRNYRCRWRLGIGTGSQISSRGGGRPSQVLLNQPTLTKTSSFICSIFV